MGFGIWYCAPGWKETKGGIYVGIDDDTIYIRLCKEWSTLYMMG